MDVVSYKCPNCSAPLTFEVDSQNWDCKFCGSQFERSQLESIEALGGTEKIEPVAPSPEVQASYESGAVAYSCPSCGGRIVTDATTAATFCVFCHNPTVIASNLKEEKRPVRIIPFKLKKDEAAGALQKLCKKRPLLPRDFREYGLSGEVSGLYVPFWLYSADVAAQMSATATRVKSWSDSNYRYTKTDTYQVLRSGEASFRHVPADGSSKMDDKLMDALEPFRYEDMVEFTMEYLSGHFAESYDVDAVQAAPRAVSRMRDSAGGMIRGTVSGYSSVRVDNLQIQERNLRHMNVMLPVWMMMVPYKDKTYAFGMNGQTGKRVGKLPLSMGRFFALLGIIGALLSLIVFIGGMFI